MSRCRSFIRQAEEMESEPSKSIANCPHVREEHKQMESSSRYREAPSLPGDALLLLGLAAALGGAVYFSFRAFPTPEELLFGTFTARTAKGRVFNQAASVTAG